MAIRPLSKIFATKGKKIWFLEGYLSPSFRLVQRRVCGRECQIPYVSDIAGGWLDQPFVSKLAGGRSSRSAIEPILSNSRTQRNGSGAAPSCELNSAPGHSEGDRQNSSAYSSLAENPPGTTEFSRSQEGGGRARHCSARVEPLDYEADYWPSKIIGPSG